MRRIILVSILIFLGGLPAAAQAQAPIAGRNAPPDKRAPSSKTIAPIPLFFEANEGQTDPRVRFLTRSSGYTLFLTPTETVLAEGKMSVGEGLNRAADAKTSPHGVVRMEFVGANSAPVLTGIEELPGKVNYLIGNDPRLWHTGVPLYSKVWFEQVYRGVDLLFHGDEQQLEYDFIVSPGTDPNKIAFRITGAEKIEIDLHGNLVLHTPDSEFRMQKPTMYQLVGAERLSVEGGFVLKGKHELGFKISAYDRGKPLVIDPTIRYATFLGGAGSDAGNDIALDTSNPLAPKIYVPGQTSDITTFPESSAVLGVSPGGTQYTFLAKIDPTLTGAASLDYLTFIGGSVSFSGAVGCTSKHGHTVLDLSLGAASIEPVLVGTTNCRDFPVNPGVVPTVGAVNDDYVTRLMPSGAAIDSSIFFGGNGAQGGGWVSVDGSGNVILSDATTSTNLPTTTGAYVSTFNNGATGTYDDCFVARFGRSLTIQYLTYLNVGGGTTSSNVAGCGAIAGPSGQIGAGGSTFSATAFNLGSGGASLANGFQTTFQGTADTFLMVLDPSLSGTNQLRYATYFGGGGSTLPGYGALTIGTGVVAIAGNTTSGLLTNPPDIPLQNAYQSTNQASPTSNKGTGFFALVDTTQSGAASLLCSSYLGGTGGDDSARSVTYDPVPGSSSEYRIVIGGQTTSTNFPTTANALQSMLVGGQNAFLSIFSVPSTSAGPRASLLFSTYLGGSVTGNGQSEEIDGVAVDTNHVIYARGRTPSDDFFGHTSPPTNVSGFQTTCSSCGPTHATPSDDVVMFVIATTPGVTLESIAVTPVNPTIGLVQTQQFTATGTFSDGTIQDLTNSATWSASNTAVATIATTGLATAMGGGTTTIKAALGNVSGTSILTVGAVTLSSIAVTPGNPSVTAGENLQFAATGIYSDNSRQDLTNFVTWASTTTTAATINSTGLALAGTAGQSTTISATLGSISGSTNLTVTTAALLSIVVTPVNDQVAVGSTLQFTPTGLSSDGSTSNLTNSVGWSSSNPSVATINSSGVATGVAAGQTVTITAGLGGATGSTTLRVVPAVQNQAPNTILTVAGGGVNPSNPAAAYFPGPYAAVRDSKGNTYISVPALRIVYKVDSQGNLSQFAGRGTGTGQFDFIGDGLPATQASLFSPTGLAVDSRDNLFIADIVDGRILRVDAVTHILTTVAGSGKPFFNAGYTGDGGPATSATLNLPIGVAVDTSGNIFIADSSNNVIRRVDATTGMITTYAGTGTAGFLGDNGPATQAQLNGPQAVAVDLSGNLFLADYNNSVVRKVDNSSQHIITSYAGNTTAACTGAIGDNGAANQANVCLPTGVFVDSSDNLYIADSANSRIRKVDNTANHIITTVAGTGTPCTSTATNCGDGGSPTSAQLNQPGSVFLDATGNLLITDSGDERVRVVSSGATPTISSFAGGGTGGDNGPATNAIFGHAAIVAVDGSGNIFALERSGLRLRRIDAATQTITTYAGNGIQGVIGQPNGDGGPAANASFVKPLGMTIDTAGNIYIADNLAHVVRKIDNSAQHIITTVAGNGAACNVQTNPTCGDGGPATSANFRQPFGLAVDTQGNLYISDRVLNRIRVVACGTGATGCMPPTGETAGNIYGFAGTGTAGYLGDNGPALQAQLNNPQGIGFDPLGNLFVVDAANSVIRKIDFSPNHTITTSAFNGQPTFGGNGGPALSASMNFPEEIGLDPAGNLFIGGGPINVVERVDAQNQTVVTVAGDVHNLDGGFSGDGGPSTTALIGNFGVAADANHNIYIADDLRIRKVRLAPAAAVTGAFTQFAATLPGGASAPQVISVGNNGLDSLTVSNVTISDPDFTVTNSCATAVAPSSQCVLVVTFTPLASAPQGTTINSSLTFSTSDPNNSTFTLPVSGVVGVLPGFTLSVGFSPAATGTGTVASVPGGISCPSTCLASFAPGEMVTLVAVPSVGSSFTGWSGACTGTLPCTMTMSANQNVTAQFDQPALTVTIIGNSTGTVTDNTGAINCTTATSPCTAHFPANTQLALTATPTPGGPVFVGWMGSSCVSDGVTSNCDVTVGGPLAINGVTQVTAVFSTPAKPFALGDVFLGTSGGKIFEYNSSGTLVQVLNAAGVPLGGGAVGGMTFDASGKLFAPLSGTNTGSVVTFTAGGIGPTVLAGSLTGSPNSVVLNSSGDVFVGLSTGSRALLEFLPGQGTPTASFLPAYENGGANWIGLLDDGRTMLYTSLGNDVKSFDVLVNAQYPDFATNLPAPAFALRELPDQSVLVAAGSNVLRLDTTGNVIKTYGPNSPAASIQSLYLDPDGNTFWAADAYTGIVYRFNLLTGASTQFGTGLSINPLAGIGGIDGIAVFGAAAGGGADLAISMTGSANPISFGSSLTYAIQVTNYGPSNATGITVTDNLPGGLSGTNLSSGCTGTTSITCTIANLSNGASVSFSITVIPTVQGTLQNTATVGGGQTDPDLSNNSFTVTTTVGSPALASIAVTPANPTISVNGTAQFTATGTYTDNSTQNLTSAAVWSSSVTAVATISTGGLATGLAAGTSSIVATVGTVMGSTTLTVAALPVPSISISPTSLTYPNQVIGTSSAAQTITVSNVGTAALTITSLAVTGTNPTEFTQTNNCPISPLTLGASTSCTIQVSFVPLAVGTRTAGITLTDNTNGVAGTQQTVTLSGTASAPAPVTSAPIPISFTPGTNVSQVATVNCPSGTNPCTDPNAHSLKVLIGQVNQAFTLTVTAHEVSLTEANGICEAGQTETTDFDCRFTQYFPLQTQANGDVIVPQCVPYSFGNCVYYTIGNVPPGTAFSGTVFEYIAWNNAAYTPSAFYQANNPRLFDDPDEPPYNLNHQFALDITDYFTSSGGTVGVDPGLSGHRPTFTDFVAAYPGALPTPPYTFTFVPPLGSAPSYAQGALVPVQFTLVQGTTPITNALTAPNTVSLGVVNAQGVRQLPLAADGSAAAFTYNATTQQYGLSLATQDLVPGTYTILVNSNLFVQQTATFTITPVALQIATSSPLANGTAGVVYGQGFVAYGGTPPYTWTIVSGTLPAGLTLSAAGFLNGTPTTAGTSNFTLQVTDAAATTLTQAYTLTINPAALVSIAVTPASASVAAGLTQQFTATGTYTDGSTQNLTASATWSSSATAVATVSSSGLATGVAVGSATITATSGAVSGTASLTVTAATLTSIAVTPVNPTISVNGTVQFTATGTYTDGSMQNLTASVTWSSSSQTIATIGSTGLATGVGGGTTTITATSGTISGKAALTVTPVSTPTLLSIAVTPASATIAKGTMQQFTATGTYSDKSTNDISSSVTWGSGSLAVATIDATGMATGISAGSTRITATSGAIIGKASLRVTSAALVSIVVTPANPSVPETLTLQFTAIGTFTDKSTHLLKYVDWKSSARQVALIGETGRLFDTDPGTTTITASEGKISGSTTLTVTKLSGDVNGDGVVNCKDVAIILASFGKRKGQSGFDPRADINGDGVVNYLDLSIVVSQLPPGLSCPGMNLQ